MTETMDYDVAVIGGSYAGMAAALQLARARRKVLVIDAGERRNRFASHAHGFLTQDGVAPGEIFARGRAQLRRYPTLVWHDGRAGQARRLGSDGFMVTLDDGAEIAARRLILAFGVTDTLPDMAGLAERWGRSVFHCPYCHGYELEQDHIGVLGVGPASMHQALLLPDWGPTTFFLNRALQLTPEDEARLAARQVRIETAKVEAVSGACDVQLGDGRTLALAGLFVAPQTAPGSTLATDLGCEIEQSPLGRFIATDEMKKTSVPGVFACGDVARMAGSVSLSVGDGALAGAAAHQSLIFG